MATNAAPNPFHRLAQNLASSRLSSEAIAKNLANITRGNQGYSRPAPKAEPALAQKITTLEAATQTRLSQQQRSEPVSNKVKSNPFANLSSTQREVRGTQAPSQGAQIAPSGQRRSSMFTDADDSDLSFLLQEKNPFDSESGATTKSRAFGNISSSDIGTGAGRSGSGQRFSTNYTAEQQRVIDCNDRLIVVDAFAGCGKTTTAVGFANARPNERILYMCLNSANAKEAQARFGPNVTAATTHSVAWRAIKPNRDRITNRWKPILLMDQLNLRTSREGMVVMRILSDFFNSSDVAISNKHAEQVAYEKDLDEREIINGIAQASLAWKRMLDTKDTMQMPHDAYLKMFALKAPALDYSTIIFDEAQDANPVTLQIINGQKNSKILCIGDRHQSIYQFRGSVNAMEKLAVGSTHLHLSQTWRFGPEVANIANLILGELKDEKVKIQGMGTDAPWSDQRVTTLSRTNAELFRLAAPIRGEGVHWVGGVENYRLDQVIDAFHLFIRERSLIKDPMMRNKFASWDEYCAYAEDASDGEAKVLVKVVEEFGDDVPNLIADIQKNAVISSTDADLTLTTAHRAKGMDWDYVRMSEDFEVLEEAEDIMSQGTGADMPIQDINLLYVAATRAKKAVALNSETLEWIKDIDKHRSNREAAAARQQGILNGLSNMRP
jgi:F-box protein, helicase, 18